jgi:hypothetical protein
MDDDAFDPPLANAAPPSQPLPRWPEPEATPAVARERRRVSAELDSFRRSEATLAGQIARAVARGQRVL